MKRWFLIVLLGLAAVAPAGAAPVLLVVGDSLSAGYGLPTEAGWVELLRQRLTRENLPHQVINASVSGETSAGGRARLPELLARHRPAVVLLELGGNDGLRGLPLDALKGNLTAMVDAARQQGSRVLLVGMRLPPNYGPAYTGRFERIYADLASEKGVSLAPFLLEGVAGEETLMQPDRIHASAEAQPRLLENVWPHLAPLLRGP